MAAGSRLHKSAFGFVETGAAIANACAIELESMDQLNDIDYGHGG